MRKNLFPWSAVLGAAASLVISSCAYDPYYSSIGGSYSSGFGDGYGYGGSNFSTSFFVSTGDSRWGYDPYTYCYYDYRSRRYYDPYLYGYYPVGYRPYALHGVPHPHGWRPGSRYCPPPQTVRNVTVVNYRNRESAYRNTDYSWARQVRQQPVRSYNHNDDYKSGDRSTTRQDYGPRPTSDRSWLNPFSRDSGQSRDRDNPRRGTYSGPETRNRPPVQYNSPIVRPEVRTAPPARFDRGDSRDYLRTQNSAPPQFSRPDTGRPSRRVEPSVPRSRPDFQPGGGSPGSRGDIQRPQPSASPAAAPPPAGNDQPSRGEGRGRLRSLGEG